MDRNRRGKRPTNVAIGASPYRERRAERVDVDDRTELRHHYAVEIRIRNVSSCGFMAECDEPVAIGSDVSLDIPGVGPIQAQVRWQIGSRMGGMFFDPISLRQCSWTATRAEAGANDSAPAAAEPRAEA